MKLGVALIAALVLLADADADKKDTVKQEIEKLQGKWVAVEYWRQGKKMEMYEDDPMRWEVTEDRVVVEFGENRVELSYALQPDKKPKQIDLVNKTHEGDPMRGIYELDGDKLKVCWTGKNNRDRPAKFETKSRDRRELFILKRAEK